MHVESGHSEWGGRDEIKKTGFAMSGKLAIFHFALQSRKAQSEAEHKTLLVFKFLKSSSVVITIS
jgi:hypothetical protein